MRTDPRGRLICVRRIGVGAHLVGDLTLRAAAGQPDPTPLRVSFLVVVCQHHEFGYGDQGDQSHGAKQPLGRNVPKQTVLEWSQRRADDSAQELQDMIMNFRLVDTLKSIA